MPATAAIAPLPVPGRNPPPHCAVSAMRIASPNPDAMPKSVGLTVTFCSLAVILRPRPPGMALEWRHDAKQHHAIFLS
jgi:hypothetical protein